MIKTMSFTLKFWNHIFLRRDLPCLWKLSACTNKNIFILVVSVPASKKLHKDSLANTENCLHFNGSSPNPAWDMDTSPTIRAPVSRLGTVTSCSFSLTPLQLSHMLPTTQKLMINLQLTGNRGRSTTITGQRLYLKLS